MNRKQELEYLIPIVRQQIRDAGTEIERIKDNVVDYSFLGSLKACIKNLESLMEEYTKLSEK